MSFRAFESLPSEAPDDVLVKVLFIALIVFGFSSLAASISCFIKAYRAHVLKLPKAQKLFTVLGIVLVGVVLCMTDTATSVWILPQRQPVWAISIAYFGIASVLYLLLPCCMTHEDDKPIPVTGRTHAALILISLALFISGLALVAVFWFHPDPIVGVRIASFAVNGAALILITGITVYRSGIVGSNKGIVPACRCAFLALSTAGYIVFNALESPIDLLMRLLETLSLVGIGLVAYATSYALTPSKLKVENFTPYGHVGVDVKLEGAIKI